MTTNQALVSRLAGQRQDLLPGCRGHGDDTIAAQSVFAFALTGNLDALKAG